MAVVQKSILVGYSAEQMFALVDAVEEYPQFLPWCTHTRVQSRTPQEIIATLGVRQGALHGEFTTRNTLETDRSIKMDLVSGPFRSLHGHWLLTPVEADGCRVDLSMRFAFKSALTGMLFEPLFAKTLGSLVDAFVARARS